LMAGEKNGGGGRPVQATKMASTKKKRVGRAFINRLRRGNHSLAKKTLFPWKWGTGVAGGLNKILTEFDMQLISPPLQLQRKHPATGNCLLGKKGGIQKGWGFACKHSIKRGRVIDKNPPFSHQCCPMTGTEGPHEVGCSTLKRGEKEKKRGT